MPQAIVLIATFAAAYAPTAFLANAVFYGVSGLLYAGLSIGLNLLANAIFKPDTPKPEDGQQSTRQALQPRTRHYGRVKISGPWTFAADKNGDFHKIISLGQGPFAAFEEFWLDDTRMEIQPGDIAFGLPLPPEQCPIIRYRFGNFPEIPYDTGFSEWTSDHRGDGVASLYTIQKAVSSEGYVECYPNGINTNYRVVVRASIVQNILTGDWQWSDNGADVIRDYLRHGDGLRVPASLLETPLAIAGFEKAYNKAWENVPLKIGGTERRYRLWGSYNFQERPADILGRMLGSCDGRIEITPDGGLTLNIGEWYEPTAIIDQTCITSVSEFGRGKSILETANMIRANYTDPTQDFQTAEADPWFDEEDVLVRGEIPQEVAFIMTPSHSQCRRLMKLQSYRANPKWVGAITCNLKAMAAFGERLIRLKYPRFGIDEVFEVLDFRFNIGENNILSSVTLQIQSMPEEAYNWDAVTEEGTAPAKDSVEVDRAVPIPTNFDVIIQIKDVGGQRAPYAHMTFDAPPSVALLTEAQAKLSTDTAWTPIGVEEGASSADTGILSDGAIYDFRIRHITLTGRPSEWTTVITKTITANTVAPTIVTSFTKNSEPHLGNVQLQFATPNDSNLSKVAIYRTVAGGVLNKNTDRIALLTVGPNSTYSYIDGDATTTELITDPDFNNPASWSYSSVAWSLSAGTAIKTVVASSAQIYQAWSVAPIVGDVVRFLINVSATNGTATLSLVNRTTIGSGGTAIPLGATTGLKFGTLPVTVAETLVGVTASGSRSATLEYFYAYIQTASCAPQGLWDYYIESQNISSVPSVTMKSILNVPIV